jgi:hypothetical protein
MHERITDETAIAVAETPCIPGTPKFAEQLSGAMSTHARKL